MCPGISGDQGRKSLILENAASFVLLVTGFCSDKESGWLMQSSKLEMIEIYRQNFTSRLTPKTF